MKGYKGFNKDMTCRDFQYEEGKEYTTDNAKLCESGFHACEYPLDCFRYYAPGESVYHSALTGGNMSALTGGYKSALYGKHPSMNRPRKRR